MKKIETQTLVKSWLLAQGFYSQKHRSKFTKAQEALNRAWLIKDRYSASARINVSHKQSLKFIKREAVEIYFVKKKYLISSENFVYFYFVRQNENYLPMESSSDSLFSFIKNNEPVKEERLKLQVKEKSSKKTLASMLKSWKIIAVYKAASKFYWSTESFYRNIVAERKLLALEPPQNFEIIILSLLQSYPFLNLTQIETLSGISKHSLGAPLYQLSRSNKIKRVFTEGRTPHEKFYLPETLKPSDVNWENVELTILDKDDPILLLLTLEPNFTLPDLKYYIFIQGIVQAGFNLIKKKGITELYISNFQRLEQATFRQKDILEKITAWGKKQNTNVSYDNYSSPIGTISRLFVRTLVNRGYAVSHNKLILNRLPKQKKAKITGKYTWVHAIKALQDDGNDSCEMFLNRFVQIESIDSLFLRFDDAFSLEKSTYKISGINHKIAFVTKKHISNIYSIHHSKPRLKLIDNRILSILKSNPKISTDDITNRVAAPLNKIILSLKFLEMRHQIRRVNLQSVKFEENRWILFKVGLNLKISSREVALQDLVLLFLKEQIPATFKQLLRYFRVSSGELTRVLNLLRNQEILQEGYFLNFLRDIQYTTKTSPIFKQTLNFPEKSSETPVIKFFPASDPVSLLLFEFIEANSELVPAVPFPKLSEAYFLIADYQPVGYITKIRFDKNSNDLDYLIDIFILKDMTKPYLLSLIVESFSRFFRRFHQQNGALRNLNNLPITTDSYKNFLFGIELLGFGIL